MDTKELQEFLNTLNRILEQDNNKKNLKKFINKIYEKGQNDLIKIIDTML